ncbi:hypothetical protein GCM10011362_17200 [Marinobacter halophilus]|nr:hypothetical protein GCM10011362_17200 [Marinobacter halophilus]
MHAGVGNQNLIHAGRGGITTVGGEDIIIQLPSQSGKLSDQFRNQAAGLTLQRTRSLLAAICVFKFKAGLVCQLTLNGTQLVSDEMILTLFGKIWRAETHGKQDSAKGIDDIVDCLMGRQLTAAEIQFPPLLLAPVTPFLAQLIGDPINKALFRFQCALLSSGCFRLTKK